MNGFHAPTYPMRSNSAVDSGGLAELALIIFRKAEIVYLLLVDRRAGVVLLRPVNLLALFFGRRLAGGVLRKRAGSLLRLVFFRH